MNIYIISIAVIVFFLGISASTSRKWSKLVCSSYFPPSILPSSSSQQVQQVNQSLRNNEGIEVNVMSTLPPIESHNNSNSEEVSLLDVSHQVIV